MVLLGLVISLQGGVLSDARLTAPKDFDVSLSQITDFCSDVSLSSGVKFSVAKNIQDLKVDVFVDGRPLGETIDKVAKVLDCQWVPVEKGYRLEMDVPTANRERNFVKAEDDLRLEDLKLKLWGCQYVASKLPYSNEADSIRPLSGSQDSHVLTRKEIDDQLMAAFRARQQKQQEFMARITKEFDDELKAAVIAKDETRTSEAVRRISALNFGYRESSLGRVLLQLSTGETEDFWKGISPALFMITVYKY